jgi:hypothetical protein
LSSDNKENQAKLALFLKDVSAKNCPNSFKKNKKFLPSPQAPNTNHQTSKVVPALFRGVAPLTEVNDYPRLFFWIGKGNNEHVIKEILSKRLNWVDCDNNLKLAHFRWQQTSKGMLWDTLGPTCNRGFNHFEFNSELGRKDNLAKNLKRYLEKSALPIRLFDVMPFTVEFLIQNDKSDSQASTIKQIFELFAGAEEGKDLSLRTLFGPQAGSQGSTRMVILSQGNQNNPEVQSGISLGSNSTLVTQLKARNSQLSKKAPDLMCYGGADRIPSVFIGHKNLWLIKPTCLNRGKGIELVTSYEGFQQTVQRFRESACEDPHSKRAVYFRKFLIQKYCENLLLIDNRKFDIRVWCLIDHNLNLFFCREGYLRMSSFPFSMEKCTDKFVHLTNNAVQKHSEKYSLYEKGNQKSFAEFRAVLKEVGLSFDNIYDKIKWTCGLVLRAVASKLNYNRRRTCFEIFGLDFIVDRLGGTWLLEANVNPCIETSSPLLEKLIPRMLDDAFKMTLDRAFKTQVDSSVVFPVDNLKDEESIWVPLPIEEPKQQPMGGWEREKPF